jgi:hypothetical protein
MKNTGNYGITSRVQDGSGEWSKWSEINERFSKKLIWNFPIREKLIMLKKLFSINN